MTRIVCDVSRLAEPDLAAVAMLARLRLEARRLGLVLRLLRAPPELRELIAFLGLAEALPVEPRGEAEEREEALGVEEEGELGDLPA